MSTKTSSSRRAGLIVLLTVPVTAGLVLAGGDRATAGNQTLVLAVGIPAGGPNGDGEVHTVMARGGSTQRIDEQRFGLPHTGGERARFGAAILPTEDINGDWSDDLLVGAPGTLDGTDDPTGRVDVFFGSPAGIVTAGATRLPGPVEPGDEFGSALAVGPWDDEDEPDRRRTLWVGAPGRDVNGQADAGAVLRYRVSASEGVTYLDTVTEDSPGVPGRAEAGDRFGAVLARDGFAGMPGKDLGPLKDAGTVLDLRTSPMTEWNQDSPGVGGAAEAGDRFGAAVASWGYGAGLVVGAPGEDVGAASDAGLVQTFTRGTGQMAVPWRTFTQNSPGVPGSAETGDRFGAAVTSGFFRTVTLYTVVGAPGEDIGTAKDAGAITAIRTRYSTAGNEGGLDGPALSLRQGKGLPGSAESGDMTGAALGMNPSFDTEDAIDILMVGVPGEDVGTVRDRGMVILDALGNEPGDEVSTDKGPAEALQRFGSVLP